MVTDQISGKFKILSEFPKLASCLFSKENAPKELSPIFEEKPRQSLSASERRKKLMLDIQMEEDQEMEQNVSQDQADVISEKSEQKSSQDPIIESLPLEEPSIKPSIRSPESSEKSLQKKISPVPMTFAEPIESITVEQLGA